MLYIVIRRGTPCRFAESKVNAGIGDVEKRRRRPQPWKVTNAISLHTIFVSSALGVNRALALDMGFGTALSQKLKTPLGKIDDLAFIVLLRLILVGLDLLVRDLFDHVNNVV